MLTHLRLTISIALPLIALVLASCGSSVVAPLPFSEHATLAVSERENGGQAGMTPGDQLAIYLSTNPSTGYGWQVTRGGGQVIALLGGPEILAPQSDTPGATQRAIFRFRALTSGTATIELQYKRPWEKEVPPAQRYVINVTVR